MHWIDWAIVTVLGLSVITGLFRGFVKELLALIVWGLSFWLAYQYGFAIYPWVSQFITDPTAAKATSFGIIFIGVLVAGGIISALLGFMMRYSGLSGTDRLLGMVFGFARGVIVVGLFIFIINQTSLPFDEYEKSSKFYAGFNPVVAVIGQYAPSWVTQIQKNTGHETLAEDDGLINPDTTYS